MHIVEVGPRDGLQSEARVLSVDDRLELIRRCAAVGASRIEVASFVHPKLVPQMAHAEEVVAGLDLDRSFSAIGVVLNRRGMERALTTAIDEVNTVVAAAEGYNRKNMNTSVEETMSGIEVMLPDAIAAGKRVTVTISVAFGDPFDGEVSAEAVRALAERAAAAGAHEIALGDTIGAGVPSDVSERINAVRDVAPDRAIRCHFHNTRNTGYANAVAALAAGVDALDAAVGGYGGSPFAPGAGGNIATEDLAHMLERMGMPSGLNVAGLTGTAAWLESRLDSPAAAMLGKAGSFPG